MSFRLVSSGGSVGDPAFVNLAASGGINAGDPVVFVRGGTGGSVVAPMASGATVTQVFGVSVGPNVQGASDTFVNVILFHPSQVWEVDCVNAAATSAVGYRHAISATRGYLLNYASDDSTATGCFTCLGMVGSTTGSGKLLVRANAIQQLVPVNSTTFLQ